MRTAAGATPGFVATGGYPARAGNFVAPLIDGGPAFRRICEAIEAAQHSVWATVTFLWASFQMPDGRGSALDVLDRAAGRGLDVRLLFWRPDEETADLRRNAFWGAPDHFALLAERGQRLNVRWDRAHPGFCQHQKTWLIDAGQEAETAFVGGINLNPHSVAWPGHEGSVQNHDVYVELAGPAAVDVHHNFVQRWNEASERLAPDGIWGTAAAADLSFPERVPARRGAAAVQIQRTTHAGRYTDGRPPPGGAAFSIAGGERTIFEQYRAAIQAANEAIYIESQYLENIEIVHDLSAALMRGVEVALLLPAVPALSARYLADPERTAFLAARAALAAQPGFTLSGIAGRGADGDRTPVYVHAKLMLIDDQWATVGSCNLHRYSLFGNGEMNATFEDAGVVRAFRVALLKEHLGQDTSDLSAGQALRLFREIAGDNRKRLDAGDAEWRGLAFALDMATYGAVSPF